MGIKTIGSQGLPFEQTTVERVRILRTHYPNVKISVDGGVSLETVPHLIAAGADQLVVGSALWSSVDPRQTLLQLQIF